VQPTRLAWRIVLLAASSCSVPQPEHTRVSPGDPSLHYVGWFDRTNARDPSDDETREGDRIEVIVDGVPRKTFALSGTRKATRRWRPSSCGLTQRRASVVISTPTGARTLGLAPSSPSWCVSVSGGD
jgi:hypothetical protein